MLNKNNFFHNTFKTQRYKQNLKRTKFFFKSIISDLKGLETPLLESYDKSYQFDFTAQQIKKFSKYKNIIIIGMGGSILGTKSIYSFLVKKIKKEVFFFDNLDNNLHLQFKKIKNLNNSCFIVVSKSGDTLETITNLGIILSKTSLRNKLILITETKDSRLMAIATKYNADVIEHKEYISGRYSVLSEVGMFPAALMGLNVSKFKNLKTLIKNKNFVSALIQNVAYIHTFNEQGSNNSVILNYDSNLNDLGYWYQQLVGESLGKKEKGINPILSFGPKYHHSLLQLYLDGPKDKFFTFFTSSKIESKNLDLVVKAQVRATKKIFELKKIPFRQIIFNKKNEEELGKIFIFFILETILLARLMNVDPFDQPAVEQIKIETKKIL